MFKGEDILTKFLTIVIGYFNIITEKINIRNKQYYFFILERGLETLIHVFTFIFYYTKNLDLTFYHCQKAYYFYIEFIEQISDDNITFLQLTSRDATTFVYKKTIYEISNDYKKNISELTNEDKSILKYVDIYISIYKSMFYMFIKNILNQSITNISNQQQHQKFLDNIRKKISKNSFNNSTSASSTVSSNTQPTTTSIQTIPINTNNVDDAPTPTVKIIGNPTSKQSTQPTQPTEHMNKTAILLALLLACSPAAPTSAPSSAPTAAPTGAPTSAPATPTAPPVAAAGSVLGRGGAGGGYPPGGIGGRAED